MIAIRVMVLVAAGVGFVGLFLGVLVMALCTMSGDVGVIVDQQAEIRRLELLLDAEREKGGRWNTQGGPVPSEG